MGDSQRASLEAVCELDDVASYAVSKLELVGREEVAAAGNKRLPHRLVEVVESKSGGVIDVRHPRHLRQPWMIPPGGVELGDGRHRRPGVLQADAVQLVDDAGTEHVFQDQ